jgi:branched-chain amino acid transport system permease protein
MHGQCNDIANSVRASAASRFLDMRDAMSHRSLALAGIAVLALLPLVLQALDQGFYIGFAARLLIFAIAASSLNLILGNGGMLSFGHAAFIGAGAYTVGILAAEGFSNAWITWPLAVAVAALTALVIGALSLRTRGVYFIMITLAFAQMIYYILVSLKAYGGDDGLNLSSRSSVGFGLDLKNELTWYYLCLALMVVVLYLLNRMMAARFGRALEAIRENETRMEAIGFATYRHKLVAFVIAGAIAGLAGVLLANHNSFVSPKLMHWTQSGLLMVMVIVGGVGHRYAGLIGAVVLLGLEELIAEFTLYSQLWVGIVLLAIVLFAPTGIAGLFQRRTAGQKP